VVVEKFLTRQIGFLYERDVDISLKIEVRLESLSSDKHLLYSTKAYKSKFETRDKRLGRFFPFQLRLEPPKVLKTLGSSSTFI
jgi:hypothetical protein